MQHSYRSSSPIPRHPLKSHDLLIRKSIRIGKRILSKLTDEGIYSDSVEYFKLHRVLFACLNNDAPTLDSLLSCGTDVNELAIQRNIEEFNALSEYPINWTGYTCLHIAAELEMPTIIQVLLKHGADVNFQGFTEPGSGMSPLHVAATATENEQILRFILSAGCNESINSVLLHQRNRPDAPKVFAEVNAVDALGNTALHYAVSSRLRNAACTMLLNTGADVSIQNSMGITAVHIAAMSRVDDTLNVLLHCDDKKTNPKNLGGFSHLHAACMQGDITAVETYIQNGENMEEAVGSHSLKWAGYTPLHFSVENNRPEVTKLLLSHGAGHSSQVTASELGAPLHLAAREGHVWMVQILLSYKVNVNALDVNGNNALQAMLMHWRYNGHEVDRREYGEIINLLLEADCDVYSRNKSGLTALHMMLELEEILGLCSFLRFYNLMDAEIYRMHVNAEPDDRMQNSVHVKMVYGIVGEAYIRREMVDLKEVRVGMNLSLYDILFLSKEEMMNLLRSDDFKRSIKSSDLERNYCIFGPVISRRYEEAMNGYLVCAARELQLTC